MDMMEIINAICRGVTALSFVICLFISYFVIFIIMSFSQCSRLITPVYWRCRIFHTMTPHKYWKMRSFGVGGGRDAWELKCTCGMCYPIPEFKFDELKAKEEEK